MTRRRPARTLMIQGTGSNVGKSLLCTALCRQFSREGYRVAPFKAQNMSLNAYVTPAGEEIARAQALQAEAAGIDPTADMNPLLLKPQGDRVAQVVLHGRAVAAMDALAYRADFHRRAWAAVRTSLARLRSAFDLVIIEGAGSPAEVNLRRTDLANMRVARAAEAPVLLVGDIDRGGVFAALLGTLSLLAPSERRRVAGLVVNKFRGDPRLFEAGVAFLEARARRPVLGVLPWVEADLEDEDSLALERLAQAGPAAAAAALGASPDARALDVAVPRYPRLANFSDLDALRRTPGLRLRFVASGRDLGRPDAIVLPGSKSTAADLLWLRARGLARAIAARAREGTPVAGLCGGYQMLGGRLLDPEGVESPHADVPGLGLLPVETVFSRDKVTARATARLAPPAGPLAPLRGEIVGGYEIHAGRTARAPGAAPLLTGLAREGAGRAAGDGDDGCVTPDGRIWGTYLHGIFDNERFRLAWVNGLRARRGWAALPLPPAPPAHGPLTDRDRREREFDRLADWVSGALDLGRVRRLAGLA